MGITHPPGFQFQEKGLFLDGVNLGNFMVCPTKVYRRQGDSFPFACDLEIHTTEQIRSMRQIPFTALTPDWWKNPPPGCWYNAQKKRPDKEVQRLFQACIANALQVEVVQPEKIGWTKLPSGKMAYITGDQVIGGAPEDNFLVWPPEHAEELVFEEEPSSSLEDAMTYFWDLFHTIPGVTDVLMVYTLFSFLSPLFREAGLASRFPIVLEGATESKKTTLATLTCGAFRRKTNPRGCMVGLTSTRSAVELRAGQMRHCTLIVDDLFPDGGRSQQEKALNLIRDFANQDAREIRSGKSIVGNRLDCGMVITAEFFPPCERSTRTRCLRLKLQERIPNTIIYPFQEFPALLSIFFKAYLERTAKNYHILADKVAKDLQEYRKQRALDLSGLIPSERLSEIGFMLYETLDLLFTLFPSQSHEDCLNGFQEEINQWIAWQLSPEAVPELRDIVSSIPLLYQQHPEQFREHRGCWCITPDALCQLLQGHYQDPTIDRAYVIQCLQSRMVLKKDRSRAATKKIAGQRYLHLIPHRLWGS